MSEYIASGFWRSIWVLFLVFLGSGVLCIITTFLTKNEDKKLTVLYMTLFIPPILTLIYIWRVRHGVGWLITGIVFALGLIGGAIGGFDDEEEPKSAVIPKNTDDNRNASSNEKVRQAEINIDEAKTTDKDNDSKETISQWIRKNRK